MGDSSNTLGSSNLTAESAWNSVSPPSLLTLDDPWHAAILMPLWDSQRHPTIISMEAAPAAMCNTGYYPCSDNRCIAVSTVMRTPILPRKD